MKHGVEPSMSIKDVYSPKIADREDKQAAQNLLANESYNPMSLSAIGIGLVSLMTMLGVRLRRGLQPPGGLGFEMPMNTVSALGDNVMEMKSQDSSIKVNSGRVGWGHFAPRVSHHNARTALNAADDAKAPAFPTLANAEVVILHRSRSSLAAVAYELAASLQELETVGVGVATDGDGADANALRSLKGVRTLTPADGLSSYDDALTTLFEKGDASRRRILVDASSITADAAAERARTAENLGVDALCVLGDALMADDGSGTRGLVDNKTPALAPGLEAAVRTCANHFPGGASVVRCELVLGANGADESYQNKNHPLAYFFERFARNRMAPIAGPGPRSGGPPMLVGISRAADVAKLVEATISSEIPLGVVTAGPVRPHDLAPATYLQLARAAGFACGIERVRLPLYAPGGGWREKVGFPFADAPRHLDASTTAASFKDLPAVPDARRDAAIVASTPPKRYGARKLTFDADAASLP